VTCCRQVRASEKESGVCKTERVGKARARVTCVFMLTETVTGVMVMERVGELECKRARFVVSQRQCVIRRKV
jgi:hypothetical protein